MLVNPSDAFTGLPVEEVAFCDLGAVEPPPLFQISYSTLEAKKSAVCSTEIIDVFCLEDST